MKNLIIILIVLMVGGMSSIAHAQSQNATALITSSNNIKSSVSSYINKNSAIIANTIDDLPLPVTTNDVQGLTDAQKKARLLNGLKLLIAILNDTTIGSDKGYYTTHLQSLYATPTAAYNDIANHYTGTTKTAIQTNLSTGNTAWNNQADILLDDAFLSTFLNAVKAVSGEWSGINGQLQYK